MKGVAAMAVALEAAALASTAAVVKISDGLEKLYYASERTNSKVGNLKAFSYAASQLGSTAEGAAGSLEALAQNMRSSPGYEGMLKNLGVATRQNGKLRDLTEVTMELGDAFAKMPHFQAKAYADALGIDERTLIALKDGSFKKAVLEYREMLGKAGVDPDRAAKDSAAFMNMWRRMWAAVDILFTRIGAALTTKFGAQIGRLTDYLLANADGIAKAVIGIGETLLRLATRVVDLIGKFNDLDPATKQFLISIAAVATALLLLKSGPVAALLALAGAIVVLYDDYQKWREGAKDTLIPWDRWWPAIQSTLNALKDLWEGFDRVAKAITGQDGLTAAFAAFAVVLAAKVLAPLGKVVGLLGTLGAMRPPTWLLGLLGIGVAAKVANDAGILDAGAGSRSWHESVVRTLDPGIADRIYGKTQQGAERGPNIVSRGLGWVKGKLGLGPAPDGLLDNIARAEGTAGRPGNGYNTSLGYGKYLPGGKEQTLTDKTLAEILDLGKFMRQQPGNPNSSALGRYQIVGSTLKEAIKALGLDPNTTKFDEKTQDQIAHWIARQQGLGAWEGFKTHPKEREAARRALERDDRSGGQTGSNGKAGGDGANVLEGGGRITSKFGPRQHPIHGDVRHHNGVDLAATPGTGVKALKDGKVVKLNEHGDITIEHEDGSSSTYRHVVPSVKQGDAVKGGGRIGAVGPTDSRSTGPHLHLEMRDKDGKLIDPQTMLERMQSAVQDPDKPKGSSAFEQRFNDSFGAGNTAGQGSGLAPEVNAAVEKLRKVALQTAEKVEQTLVAYPEMWIGKAEGSIGKINPRGLTAEQWKAGGAFQTSPLGAGDSKAGKTVYDQRTFNDQRTTTATVTGVSDPKEAASHITGAASRQRSDLIGNFNNRYA
ncbi:M23 family metallopeptidase [Methylobacterium sp. CCH5-D2]|uniref:M23 family metallopeptidase n=1 Tax=Methylobacterium sp. CCH5-D2 TaxID=1768765 RepID=UPI000B1CCF42|nr:M23 family metallopeptidase [Methylobacterium sp. CCH5-D2]